MKLSLLIADDEAIVRKALYMQINSAFPEITLLEPAENGLQLVDSVRKFDPDIVLADIEMPGMNGLHALEQLREEGFQPYTIIITAYSSEHYLKQSLSLRVHAYLEKPVKRDNILHTIRKSLTEISAERKRKAEMENMRSILDSLQDMIRSEMMMCIESDEADPNQIVMLHSMLKQTENRWLVMTFSMSDAEEGRPSLLRSVHELECFDSIRNAALKRGWIVGHVLNHRRSCLVPVPVQVSDAYHIRQWACSEADALLTELQSPKGLRIGIGEPTERPELFQKSRQQSIQALFQQDKTAQVCHFQDQPVFSDTENPFHREEALLLDALQNGNIASLEGILHSCFEGIQPQKRMDIIRYHVFETLLTLNRRSATHMLEERMPEIAKTVQACADIQELERYMIRILCESIQQKQETEMQWQQKIIEQAKQYIDAYYSEDISLESTAEAVGVSKFYLSRLFKTCLGMNYSTYLTEQRVRIAATLIQQRKLSNREIAMRVGFRDADYFGKVFKRMMECTMTEYRDKLNG